MTKKSKSTLTFKNKIVLVTGAASGIGAAIALAFKNHGAQVYGHYSSSRPSKNYTSFKANFSNTTEVEALWKQFLKATGGKIDILVNNAATTGDANPFLRSDPKSWADVFQVNIHAPLYLSQKALAVMIKNKRGSIINVSSIGVKFGGGEKTVAYSASKAALEAITKSLSKLGAPHNVRVNAVQAGVVQTKLHTRLGTDLKKRAALIPMKRLGTPQEVAQAVTFLASPQSSYISGAIVPVSGGE